MVSGLAYIGPGAGFAFLGSFLILFAACCLAVLSIILLPFRMVLKLFARGPRRRRTGIQRAVVVGLDGLDPRHTKRLMADGSLPNLAKLAGAGVFSELRTTCPPMSPVAWSSFMTGVNPGKHNIFDFLNRDLKTYAPALSSSRIRSRRGPLPFRLAHTTVEALRKSQPFWRILGEHGLPSTILRVPITFPPEEFRGLLLSAMCVPDLRGTQGAYTLYDSCEIPEEDVGEGVRIHVTRVRRRIRTHLPGPPLGADGNVKLPVSIRVDPANESATVRLGCRRVRLTRGVYSDWVPVTFRSGLRRATGLCRLLLLSLEPHFKLYVTPINIDPGRPAMPISHPRCYSAYLARLVGPYATLGLAEDTWALSHGVISEQHFLQQVWDIHAEREHMFLESLSRMPVGFSCCVFDAADRVQHMFWNGSESSDHGIIDETYRKLDATVGKIMAKLDEDTPLFVMSDHGFSSFKRGVNLNAWLKEQGLLFVTGPGRHEPDLSTVDWSRTKAYSFGLSGVYLNLQGREARGIVTGDEARSLKTQIADKLRKVVDPLDGRRPVRAVYDAAELYTGPYADAGPDLVVGYDTGYRASWEAALGRTDGEVFADNERPWSGDHCLDHNLVPGVLFCNKPLELPGAGPHITDLAPTMLNIFGIDVPGYMDGKPFTVKNGN